MHLRAENSIHSFILSFFLIFESRTSTYTEMITGLPWHRRSQRFRLLILFFSLSPQLIAGLAKDPSSTADEKKAASHNASNTSVGLRVLIIFLGLVAIVAFAVLLFKIWQKKKREQQQARLLKLFEDDDELEVELGLRD